MFLDCFPERKNTSKSDNCKAVFAFKTVVYIDNKNVITINIIVTYINFQLVRN